jgi:hypothetical protein
VILSKIGVKQAPGKDFEKISISSYVLSPLALHPSFVSLARRLLIFSNAISVLNYLIYLTGYERHIFDWLPFAKEESPLLLLSPNARCFFVFRVACVFSLE